MKHKFVGGGLLNKHNSLKLQKFKENNSKRKVIVTAIIISVLLLSGVYLYSSFAVFSEEKNFNVINGTVSDPGDIYFAYYVDGVITRNMPSQNTGYTLNTEKSTCTNGVIPSWDNAGWKFIGDYHNYNATDYTRTRCNLYFEKTSKLVSTVLGNIDVNTYTPDFSKSACDDSTCESHEKGIYETQDDDGISYYYRGSVENNYVKFAGYYWRIIRINGNGSIRMIYDGTMAHDNGEISEDRVYMLSSFNKTSYDNAFVGYMYTSGQVHGTNNNSNIKINNDNFYSNKLSSKSSYISTSTGFCGDRETLNNASDAGTGTVITKYKGFSRFSEHLPSLKCINNLDYYTVSGASTGNKALTYPIGLITADEALMAGIASDLYLSISKVKTSLDNYLISPGAYWTMTPIGYYNPIEYHGTRYSIYSAYELSITSSGSAWESSTGTNSYLRPVINLKNTLKFTGNGTKNNPYVPSL